MEKELIKKSIKHFNLSDEGGRDWMQGEYWSVLKENVPLHTYSEKHIKYQRHEKVGSWGKVDILHEKPDGRRSLSFFMTEFPEKRTEWRLKEIHLYQDSRSSNLVILEALEKYGVKTGDILPPQKGVWKEDSDWRESLTFKQALYPYRVGEDMHNPSKMHMNFPSSNSSRLNSSQWINYEYCMYWIVGDQIEFTVKKNQWY